MRILRSQIFEKTINAHPDFFKCAGYANQQFAEKIWLTFPFQVFQEADLPFVFENGVFHSSACAANYYCLNQNELWFVRNASCDDLRFNHKLENLIEISVANKKHTNYAHLGHSAIVDKLYAYSDRAKQQRLQNLNLLRENLMLRNRIDLHERFKVLIANNDISRLRVIIGTCLSNGYGLRTIITNLLFHHVDFLSNSI